MHYEAAQHNSFAAQLLRPLLHIKTTALVLCRV